MNHLRRIFSVIIFILIFFTIFSCSTSSQSNSNTVSKNSESSPHEDIVKNSTNEIKDISAELVDLGYSSDQALSMKSVLQSVGIESIELFAKDEVADDGTQLVICNVNGNSADDERIYFLAGNDTILFIGMNEYTLYDTESGGVVNQYSDMPTRAKNEEPLSANSDKIRDASEYYIKLYLNNPDSAKFPLSDYLYGWDMHEDYYALQGEFSAQNALGVTSTQSFFIVLTMDDDSANCEYLVIDGDEKYKANGFKSWW